MPLVTDHGHVLGSFCAIDTKPHPWTDTEVEVLTELAASAQREIHLRSALRRSSDLAERLQEQASELEHQAIELEQQVEEAHTMAEELEQTNEELLRKTAEAQHANRAKGDFLAAMSHELRTPLNAIGGYVELLQMGLRGPITAEQNTDLARIQRNQAHLLGLISDILNFAQIGAGRIEHHWADVALDAAIQDAEAMILPQIQAKRFNYTHDDCGTDIVVRADRDKLRQIFLNLLSNAAKFTDTGGSITVRCRRMDDAAIVQVIDTGSGIDPEKLDNIFEPFVQVERTLNRPAIGIGLGLSISRDLARGMGGDLTVESSRDGSTFTLTLPIGTS